MSKPVLPKPHPLAGMVEESVSMHEAIDIALLPGRLDEVSDRLRMGERIVVTREGQAVAALISVLELVDLDETDAVLEDQGLLEQLREAQAAGEDPSTYEP